MASHHDGDPPTSTPRPSPSTTNAPASTGGLRGFVATNPTLHLVIVGVLVAAVLVVAVWRFLSVRELESELAKTRKQARAAMVAQTGELLRLSASPLAWAIRAEAITNDLGDIDAYMAKLVQNQYVRRIAYIDAAGKVVASTNVKLKGQQAEAAFPGLVLARPSGEVENVGDEVRMVVPVMDFDRQIGTLVLEYALASVDSKLTPR